MSESLIYRLKLISGKKEQGSDGRDLAMGMHGQDGATEKFQFGATWAVSPLILGRREPENAEKQGKIEV